MFSLFIELNLLSFAKYDTVDYRLSTQIEPDQKMRT